MEKTFYLTGASFAQTARCRNSGFFAKILAVPVLAVLACFAGCDMAPPVFHSILPESSVPDYSTPPTGGPYPQVAATPAPPADSRIPASSGPVDLNTRKLIKTGRVEFETADFQKSRTTLDSILKKYDAYVSSEETMAYDSETTARIVAKVPEEHFDALLADISNLEGKVKNRSVEIQDVTESYLDIETRLKVDRALEAQYLELLNRATTVEEILKIQESASGVRQEIEVAESRLKQLDNQISYSTLHILLSTVPVPGEEPRDSFTSQIADSIGQGWMLMLDFLLGILNLWPFWIFALLLIFFWRRRKRKNVS